MNEVGAVGMTKGQAIMEISALLGFAMSKGASDVMWKTGMQPCYRLHKRWVDFPAENFRPPVASDVEKTIKQLVNYVELETDGDRPTFNPLEASEREHQWLFSKSLGFSFFMAGVGRFRVQVFMERGAWGIVLRAIPSQVRRLDELGLEPDLLKKLKEMCDSPNGLLLTCGTMGSGKSTTLTGMVDYINENKEVHILTIEDPIEFQHKNKKARINQREVGSDTLSYESGIEDGMRLAPDVFLIGEARKYKEIQAAVTAAEVGAFVMTTLHARGATEAIGRIIDQTPGSEKDQMRMMLASSLQGVLYQQLIPIKKGGLVLVTEFFDCTATGVSAKIADPKSNGDTLRSAFATRREVLSSMDDKLIDLAKKGIISAENAVKYAVKSEAVREKLKTELGRGA